MKHGPLTLCLALVLPACAMGQADPDRHLPVDRIQAGDHHGWASVLHLTNRTMEVLAEPASGRVVELVFGAESNVLQTAEAAGGAGLRFEPEGVAADWSAYGWLSADGVQHARMRGVLGGDAETIFTRELAVGPDTGVLRIRQEVEGETEPDAGVYYPFHALRLPAPDRIVLPTEADSRLENGYRLLRAGDGQLVLNRCEGAVVLDGKSGGYYAVGTDSARGWAAAALGDRLVLVRITEGSTAPALAEGTCRIRAVNHRAAAYAELHLAGPGPQGNTVEISRHVLPTGLAPCELAAFVRALAEGGPAR